MTRKSSAAGVPAPLTLPVVQSVQYPLSAWVAATPTSAPGTIALTAADELYPARLSGSRAGYNRLDRRGRIADEGPHVRYGEHLHGCHAVEWLLEYLHRRYGSCPAAHR